MALWMNTYDPLFSGLERAFDNSINRLVGGGMLAPSGQPGATSTALAYPTDPLFRSLAGTWPMDIEETDKEYHVYSDAPGMSPEDIKVEVNDNVITISGEHKEVHREKEGRRAHRTERTVRRFTRSFVLPPDAKEEGISASLDKGVLKVSVPRTPPPPRPQPKRIAVTGVSGGPQSITGAAAGTPPAAAGTTTTTPAAGTTTTA